MTQPTHTPAPWAIQYSFEDGHHIGPSEFHTICTVKNGATDNEYGGEERELANARLIAAAPELLEALVAYVYAHTKVCDSEDEKIELAEIKISAYLAATKAIAKAKGA